MGEPDS